MSFHGHRILILESEVQSFGQSLQRAIERTGAEVHVCRDPVAALEQAKQFAFTAAVVSADHLALVDQLHVPVLVYGTRPPPLVVPFVFTPAPPPILVSALARLLGAQP